MTKFTIKDLENLSGIKAHTIRIWEQRYSFLKPSRTDTNIRYYSNDDLKTILNISILNKYGFKISHINKMTAADVQVRVAELNVAGAQQERIVNDLIQAMVDLNTVSFEKILEKQISANGIEKTIVKIVFPFFDRIGILWQTGHINPAQEHLTSNIIRQKLLVGIDQAKPILKINKSFLLFLPEREHHELGLLLVYYLLKRRGVNVFYIGANVPMKDAQFVAEAKKRAKPLLFASGNTSTSTVQAARARAWIAAGTVPRSPVASPIANAAPRSCQLVPVSTTSSSCSILKS